MAPKRKPERKTGVHTLDGAPPSKKVKTMQTTPKRIGVHTLAGSNAESKAQPSKVAPKRGLHTLADASFGHESARPSRGERSFTADDEYDGDHVEDGTTLDSDDDDLGPELSSEAQGTKESNDVHDAREHRINIEGFRLGTRSQSKAAVHHEEATRAKLMFLERLSRGTRKEEEKGVEADGGGTEKWARTLMHRSKTSVPCDAAASHIDLSGCDGLLLRTRCPVFDQVKDVFLFIWVAVMYSIWVTTKLDSDITIFSKGFRFGVVVRTSHEYISMRQSSTPNPKPIKLSQATCITKSQHLAGLMCLCVL